MPRPKILALKTGQKFYGRKITESVPRYHQCIFLSFLKNWANPGLFFVYFRSFQTNITILQQIYVKIVQMSIQYMAPGFEPTPFRT